MQNTKLNCYYISREYQISCYIATYFFIYYFLNIFYYASNYKALTPVVAS